LTATNLLHLWKGWFLAAKGRPYPVYKAKHLKMLSLLRKTYPSTEMIKFLNMHLNECTDFVRQAGHPLELLGSQIPRYIQILQQRENSVINTQVSSDEYERRRQRAGLGKQ
jgi:hypothetical protein